MKKVMILGAGKCGRGFIPRYLYKVDLTFCDINEVLIKKLQLQTSYQIHFFNGRLAERIEYENSYIFGSQSAHEAMLVTDILCISIDCSNYATITSELNEVLIDRDYPLIIITFENAINAAEKLLTKLSQKAKNNCVILNAGVFVTTENYDGLDMISQDLDYLPIQNSGLILPFKNITRIDDFPTLMKRKLYTYNCLSAIISYLGYLKNYQWLSEATNDLEILEKINLLLPELNMELANFFRLSIDEQQKFSETALKKFSDPYLKDSISRNARNVERKLNQDERLYKPLQLLKGKGRDVLLRTIAAACIYDLYEENHEGITMLNRLGYTEEEYSQIKSYYEKLLNLQ